jgi:hypothetical protein
MPSELDRITLATQAGELQRDEAHRWTVRLVDSTLKVYVALTPNGFEDRYCLRLDFGEQLSSGPPSITFCDPTTLIEGCVADWPQGSDTYFKAPPGHVPGWICNAWTREGRQQHAEWNQYGWLTTRALWRVISAMQDILDRPGTYIGRRAA